MGDQKNLIRGGFALKSGPTLCTIFDRKDTPYVYLPLPNGSPFAYLLKNVRLVNKSVKQEVSCHFYATYNRLQQNSRKVCNFKFVEEKVKFKRDQKE